MNPNKSIIIDEDDEKRIEKLKEAALRGNIHEPIPNLRRTLNIPFFVSSSFNESEITKSIRSDIESHVRYPIQKFLDAKNYKLDVIDMKWAIIKEPIQTDIFSNELELAIKMAESPFLFLVFARKNDEKYAPNEIEDKIVRKLEESIRNSELDDEDYKNFMFYYKEDKNRVDDECKWHILNKTIESKTNDETSEEKSALTLTLRQAKLKQTKASEKVLNKLYELNKAEYQLESEFEMKLKKVKEAFNSIEYEIKNSKDYSINFYFFIKKR